MEQTHASEAGLSDSALYRDASMAKLEMFLEKAKLLVEERISLGSSTTDKRRITSLVPSLTHGGHRGKHRPKAAALAALPHSRLQWGLGVGPTTWRRARVTIGLVTMVLFRTTTRGTTGPADDSSGVGGYVRDSSPRVARI
jgi:hypothetical protein